MGCRAIWCSAASFYPCLNFERVLLRPVSPEYLVIAESKDNAVPPKSTAGTLPSDLVPKYHVMASASRSADQQLRCRTFHSLELEPIDKDDGLLLT